MKNTSEIGSITEARVLSALVQAGVPVAIPFGVVRYDLIVDIKEGLKRVQCKTGRLHDNGVIIFNAFSIHRGTDKHWKSRTYHGDADYFGVFCPETDKVYMVPVDEASCTKVSLRVGQPKSNATNGIRWARDYEVDGDVLLG